MLLIFAIAPFFSTFLGGLAAFRFQHRLHPAMAFAAGLLVATALVELLPEAIELGGSGTDPVAIGMAAVVGFLFFSASEALVHRQTYEHQHPPLQDPREPHLHTAEEPERTSLLSGVAGPVGLIVHSTLDGVLIGFGFAAGEETGLIVALAVLAHDFADGLNVVTLALAGGRGRPFALGLLGLDALAPVVGVAASSQLTLAPEQLAVMLAATAGVFLSIGAGHLLPEAQHRRQGAALPLIGLAVLGAALAVTVRMIAE